MKDEKWVMVILKDGTRKSLPERLLKDYKRTLTEMKEIAKRAGWTEEEILLYFSIEKIVTEGQ